MHSKTLILPEKKYQILNFQLISAGKSVLCHRCTAIVDPRTQILTQVKINLNLPKKLLKQCSFWDRFFDFRFLGNLLKICLCKLQGKPVDKCIFFGLILTFYTSKNWRKQFLLWNFWSMLKFWNIVCSTHCLTLKRSCFSSIQDHLETQWHNH